MGNEGIKYLSQLYNYFKGENDNRGKWNAFVVIYIYSHYQYIFT